MPAVRRVLKTGEFQVAKKQSALNPFYAVLVAVGIAFVVTACAYGVMAFRAVRATTWSAAGAESVGLTGFMDRHGVSLMGGELAVLAIATFAAMGTDSFWARRAERRASADLPPAERA
jgi:hypothetical protein